MSRVTCKVYTDRPWTAPLRKILSFMRKNEVNIPQWHGACQPLQTMNEAIYCLRKLIIRLPSTSEGWRLFNFCSKAKKWGDANQYGVETTKFSSAKFLFYNSLFPTIDINTESNFVILMPLSVGQLNWSWLFAVATFVNTRLAWCH